MQNQNKIIGIIPARGGSKGIPRKNIRPLNGKPLIQYSIEAAQSSLLLDGFYVSTEDAEIKQVSLDLGAQVMDRPGDLAGDRVSTFDVLKHAWQVLRDTAGVIVCLQPTSPLRTGEDIDNAVSLLSPDTDTVVGVCFSKRYLWEPQGAGYAAPLFDERLPRQLMKPRYTENGSIYVCRVSVFSNDDSRLGMGISSSGNVKLYEMSEEHGIEIDSELDLKFLEQQIKEKNR